MGKIELGEWSVSVSRWDRSWQPQMESLFCQGNGYLGVRCAVDEPVPGQKRDTFIAGTYDSCFGEVSELPNLPDVMGKEITIDGELLQLSGRNHEDYCAVLHLDNGLAERHFTYRTEQGKQVKVKMERFVSLKNRHLLMQRLSLILEEPAKLEIRTGINGQVSNSGAQHFTEGTRHCVPGEREELSFQAWDSGVRFAAACAPRLTAGSYRASIDMDRRRIGTLYHISAEKGEEIVLENAAAFYTSRDAEYWDGESPFADSPFKEIACGKHKSLSIVDDANALAAEAAKAGFEHSLKESGEAWQRYWDLHDIRIDSDEVFDSCAARFALYHLRIMTPVHDERMNIGAKGLSGEAYKCHTFWDTEMFLFSSWLYTEPEVARRLLRYRYLTLPKAKEKAAQYGCEGALFPWESAWITDGEVTPSEGAPDVVTGKPIPIYTGTQEIHVNADIAYAVHRYFEATDDTAFMEECGYEMILETALYWASRAEWNEERKQYEIHGVIGPDEYSEHVSNNAYTNYMASWNINEALRILERLLQAGKTDLLEALEEKTGAVSREVWMKDRAEKLALPKPDGRGIIPQDEAFLNLPELDLTPFKKGGRKILESFNVEQLCGYQVLKQADVVMLLSSMPDLFPEDIILKNYQYYEARCVHDSSLSFNVHSMTAARLGMTEESFRLFRKAAGVDLNGGLSSAEGIHAAAMGGIWQCIVLGFAGLSVKDGCLAMEPHLPESWRSVSFSFVWKGERFEITVDHEEVRYGKTGGCSKGLRPVGVTDEPGA